MDIAHLVEPHAAALDRVADEMEAAGVGAGSDPRGYVSTLRRMAYSMRSEAAAGVLPHVFRDQLHASADAGTARIIAEAVAAAVKPLQDEIKALGDKRTGIASDLEKLGARLTAPKIHHTHPITAALREQLGDDGLIILN